MSEPHAPKIAPFFWLHIKKSAGGSTRRLLAPHYVQAERVHKPVTFIQSPRAQHNDILNNFRIPLGPYQFRRALFAKTYLYAADWHAIPRFAISRHPMARCLSAFFYLQGQPGGERSFVQHLQNGGQMPSRGDMHALFDAFLDLVEAAQNSPSIYHPVNLHFTTHTAAMWPDVTDNDGTLLLSHVFRLESLHAGLREIFELCNLAPPATADVPRANANTNKPDFAPSPQQRARVKQLYAKDFDLYEDALRP